MKHRMSAYVGTALAVAALAFASVIPAGATGQGTVAIQGHPGFIPAGATAAVAIPMTNASKAFAITGTATTARRTVVNIDKCNACHFKLSLHGGNRTGDDGGGAFGGFDLGHFISLSWV
jgi:hypothetical protein